MAEPAGVLIEVPVTQAKLSSFLRRQIPHGAGKASVGHVLSRLLDEGDAHGDVLIVNHDPQNDSLFLAWMLNHYAPEAVAPLWPILEALAGCVDATVSAEGAVTSTFPECLETLRIENGRLMRSQKTPTAPETLARLADRFFSFASKGSFPDAAHSMRRRNYHCKAFRTSWKNYLKWRDEQEKPARIAAATEAEPYCLFNNIFCWDGKVVDRDSYTHRDIVFPDADPLTFRYAAGFYADKNHVWVSRLAANSPPASIRQGDWTINNPEAIWEYHIFPGAVGADFTWFDDRWDTMFWTDKRRIYALGRQGLTALPDVRADQFRLFGQGFGIDGKAVYCNTTRLPLNIARLQTESHFIWDDEKAFFGETELPLSGRGFRILGQKSLNVAPAGTYFRLTDGEKTIILRPGGSWIPDEPLF